MVYCMYYPTNLCSILWINYFFIDQIFTCDLWLQTCITFGLVTTSGCSQDKTWMEFYTKGKQRGLIQLHINCILLVRHFSIRRDANCFMVIFGFQLDVQCSLLKHYYLCLSVIPNVGSMNVAYKIKMPPDSYWLFSITRMWCNIYTNVEKSFIPEGVDECIVSKG